MYPKGLFIDMKCSQDCVRCFLIRTWCLFSELTVYTKFLTNFLKTRLLGGRATVYYANKSPPIGLLTPKFKRSYHYWWYTISYKNLDKNGRKNSHWKSIKSNGTVIWVFSARSIIIQVLINLFTSSSLRYCPVLLSS